MKRSLATFVALLSPIFPALGEEHIIFVPSEHCSQQPSGSYIGCKSFTKEITPPFFTSIDNRQDDLRDNLLVNINANYVFSCTSLKTIKATVRYQGKNGPQEFCLNQSRDETVQTVSMPISLSYKGNLNISVETAAFNPMSKDCILKITNMTLSPVYESWEKTQKSFEELKLQHEKARDISKSLLLYKSGFNVIHSLSSLLLNDLTTNREVLMSLYPGDPFVNPAIPAGPAYDALQKMVLSSGDAFKLEEKITIQKFLSVLDRFPFSRYLNDECQTGNCPPLVIDSFLSQDTEDESGNLIKGDRTIIQDLARKSESITEIEQQYTEFASLVERDNEILVRIDNLKKELGFNQI